MHSFVVLYQASSYLIRMGLLRLMQYISMFESEIQQSFAFRSIPLPSFQKYKRNQFIRILQQGGYDDLPMYPTPQTDANALLRPS